MHRDDIKAMATGVRSKPIPPRRLVSGQISTRRTQVANGTALLAPEGDARGWWGRRYAEILALRLDDLGGGELLSEGQISLAKRATTLEVELERQDADLSQGKDVDLKIYSDVTGQLVRVLNTLGLDRITKVVDHNLTADYLASPSKRAAS